MLTVLATENLLPGLLLRNGTETGDDRTTPGRGSADLRSELPLLSRSLTNVRPWEMCTWCTCPASGWQPVGEYGTGRPNAPWES